MKSDYTVPIFHIKDADESQKKTMQIVFDTLKDSGVCFATVDKDNDSEDLLNVFVSGVIDYDEAHEIMDEVISVYYDELSINHISLTARIYETQ